MQRDSSTPTRDRWKPCGHSSQRERVPDFSSDLLRSKQAGSFHGLSVAENTKYERKGGCSCSPKKEALQGDAISWNPNDVMTRGHASCIT